MEIRLTTNEDIPQLKDLWHKVFDPQGVYTDLFFKYRYDTSQGMGVFNDNTLLSVLYLMPCTFKIKEKEYSARYIFAVGTFPNQRSKGYSSLLIKKVHEYLLEINVDVAILVPAEESLFNFYKKLGYETAFYVDVFEHYTKEAPETLFQKCSLAENYALREKAFNETQGFLSWDKQALEFCQIDNDYSHGEILSFPKLSQGYVVCSYFEDCVVIKELVCKKECRKEIINSVGLYFNKKRVILRDKPLSVNKPFGMMHPISPTFSQEYKKGNYYLSLPMD